MSQAKKLHQALKLALKQKTKTYRDVAECLNLSEASVKRLFATAGFTLKRIDKICEWLGIDFVGLVELMEQQQPKLNELSHAQEQQLIDDSMLLLVAISALNYWQFDEILRHYELSATVLIQKLATLDRMGILELLPGNRIKLIVGNNFKWQARGPIQTYFRSRVEQEFFHHDFNDDSSAMVCLNGMMTDDALAQLMQALEKLSEQFNELNHVQRKLPIADRHGTTLVLALRRWQFSAFADFRK
ncbi:XRE family transcriptional regulator [Corallincola holothuriorum]|uniref:XRE family transcriptional regulator n=1 Tax=Corallincola holothuriorum TaxID=2282215 RepID=A0A368NH89_9GAMM|nr:helix-turn-helix domain-containing protein [Corallincola holothuriorum]RCU49957.1 XRE family transcriptional regulator [Corallincola holothuriorum]